MIHGAKDTMVPPSHAQKLLAKCGGPCSLIINESMTHNDFSTSKDIMTPIKQFLQSMNIVYKVAHSKHV